MRKEIISIAILLAVATPCIAQMSMDDATKRLEQKENDDATAQDKATKAEIDDLQGQIKLLQNELKAVEDEVEQLRQQVAATGVTAPNGPQKSNTLNNNGDTDKTAPLAFANMKIQRTDTGPQLIGEVRNNTGKDYQFMNLTVRFYDKAGNLLEISHEIVSNFPAGSDKAFEADIDQANPTNIASYKVDMDSSN